MIKPSELSEVEILSKVANKVKKCIKGELRAKWELTYPQLVKIFRETEVCYYSGKPFESEDDITFERINPLKGYIKGNVVLVKAEINHNKGSTIDAFLHNGPMRLEDKAKLLIQLGKDLLKEVNIKKKESEQAISKRNERLSSLSEQTKLIIGVKK